MIDYVRDAAEIYRRSFAAIRAEAHLAAIPTSMEPIVVRLIHACGMIDIVDDLVYSPNFAESARAALAADASILCDSRMVREGIIARRFGARTRLHAMLEAPNISERASELGTTRSAAALDLWAPRLAGSIVAIGNAPTALFRLLELLDGGAGRPAALIAFPVGFVGAVESKAALVADNRGVPYLALLGRRGGSALAAAAINALAGDGEAA
jgi:precorrin isomerase